MKLKIIFLLVTLISTNAISSDLDAKSEAGTFAISLAGACELMKNRGVSGEDLSNSLQQTMDKESADLLVKYSTNWLDKNPNKPCGQVYVDIIDKLASQKQ
ncbi:hypothetical protein LMA04_00755 [Pseudescherichia vulneris]|uniref:hypothetical protein n=1 Tax=Pseudescherichia vulneris TaxID=566 RepID=UPI00227C5152|nr:hypothetical protein [Pseudescherichia vulneris]WAH52625.1 hypothetical protein LMA04_00755 [Pseudescherichia vulneris]